MREALYHFGASITVDNNDFVPRLERVDDQYILEVASHHSAFDEKSLSHHQILSSLPSRYNDI